MSFYGSEPIPNTAQPTAQSGLNPNAWSGTALDQLVFQDNENLLNPMGGLRRPSPQPQSSNPNFSIVDAATAELASYPADPIATDRFLLESARLDFDAALQRRPTPNHLDQRDKPSRSQPASTYPQSWDRPGAPISGSNATALPREALEIPDELGINPSGTPEFFPARNKHARKIGLGRYVQRIIDFNKEQQYGTRDGTLETFWKPLIAKFFTPDATLRIALKSNNSNKPRLIQLPVEALPRIWQTKVEAGMSGERMFLQDPCEFQYPNGAIAVDCPGTVIISEYQNRIVHTEGYLRVSFRRSEKIAAWEFFSQKHEEVFTRKGISMFAMGQPPARWDFGFPRSVIRLMMIANDVHKLKDRISEEISKIASDPLRMPGLQNIMLAGDSNQRTVVPSFPGVQATQNGNSLKALNAVLDGTQLDQSLAGNLGIALGRGAASSGGRGLAGDLDMDIKAEPGSEGKFVPNLKDAFNSWRSEQQSVMLQDMLDETVRSTLAPAGSQDVPKNAGQNHGNLNLNARKAGSNITEARGNQPRQSAIDAVAAAASGQGGWGVGAPGGSGMGTSTNGGEDLDRSLQLLNEATDGSFTPRHESVAAGRSNVQGQNAPPGLVAFTPQTSNVGRSNESQGRRVRGSGGSRGVGRGASSGQGMKEYEGLRALRRLSSSKTNREGVGESGLKGSGGGHHRDFAGTSQGLTDQNGVVGSGKNSARTESTKNVKERGHGTSVGNRRSAQRNSSTDERFEKRQKTSAQNGEQQ